MKEQFRTCRILGTDIAVTNMKQVVSYLENHLDELRGKYICVSNVHTTVMAFRDAAYQKVQNGAALALPDGKPLSFVSRRRGYGDAERVAGPDLMPEILRVSEEKGYRHYFFGSKPETLAILRKKLREQYPHLVIAGMASPPYYPSVREIPAEEDERAVEAMNAARPDFIWVGLGAPKQEEWMALHEGRVNGVMLGVGAAFDFHAGTTKRAPKWMQESYLEWLFRIFQDPKRLVGRYLSTNLTFIVQTCREGRAEKRRIRSSRMKLAMLGHKRIPSREGGVEIVVDELATRFAARGDQVEAYNRSGYHVSGKKYTQVHGRWYHSIRIITIPTFHNGKLNAIVYSVLASLRLLFGRYDVVHYHAEGPCIMLWLPKLFGIPTVATIHGLDWQRAKWGNFASKMLKFGEKTAARKADAVIVLSESMQEYFRNTYGRETIFLPNGVTRPALLPAEKITEKYGLKKGEYFLFLARLVPEKGVHYLIEAFSALQTDKKLVIAGGNSNAEHYTEKIHRMAESDSRILFTGFVQGQLLEELYSNCYAFVLPSDVEGMALSLLEAMSYGCCCVVSDIPENMEVVGEKAISFPKGDVQALRERLRQLADHPETVRRYAGEAADYICARYNWEDVAAKTREIYLAVMPEKRKKELRETDGAQERTAVRR